MSYDVQTLKNDLTGILHGTTLNQVTYVDGIINRAARTLLLDLDPQETKRLVQFVGPVFNTVNQYPIAADVKGNKIIDIRPQVRRLPRDIWVQGYNQAFDIAKQNVFSAADMFTMSFNTGIKTILLNSPYLNPPVYLDQITEISVNGTWATGGTASNLEVNNQNYVLGGGALQFDIATGAGWLENSTLAAVNLSEVQDQSYLFTNAYFQTGSEVTSVVLRFGSSSSDYWQVTATQTQQGTVFQNGWNLVHFPWESATVVGSPDSSAIDYVRITVNTTGNQTGCLLNGIYSILGTVLEYEYYSKYLFRDSVTGAFQETVTSDSNLINLDTESYNLLFNLTAFLTVQQLQGSTMGYDGSMFGQEYQKGLERYKAMYKSEVQKPQSTYYYQPTKSYSNWWGRRWGA